MNFRMRHPVTALGMLLAGATLSATTLPELPPTTLKTLTAQESSRALAAAAYFNANVLPTLGVARTDTFKLRHSLTNPQGECVARFEQYTDQVYGGKTYHLVIRNTAVVVKVAPDGTCSVSAKNVVKPHLLPTPAAHQLTPAQALEVMTAKLNPTQGYAATPTVQPVLFRAQDMGDLMPMKHPVTGMAGVNPLQGGEIFTARTAYVRAYELHAELLSSDTTKPNAQLTVFLDADSGIILDRFVTGGLEVKNPFLYASGYTYAGQTAPSPVALLKEAAAKTRVAASPDTTPTWTEIAIPAGKPTETLTPALGTGYTQYMGKVTLPTTYDPVLKGYGLLDTTRGGSANYFIQQRMGYTDTYGYYHANTLRPAGNMVVSGQGINTWTPYTMDGLSGNLSGVPKVASDLVTGRPETKDGILADNVWGDGYSFVPDLTDPDHAYGAYTATGESAAADAMNILTCNHEFLRSTFNRTGIDNQDSAATIAVNFPGVYYVLRDTTSTTGYDADSNPITVPLFLLRCGTGDPANGLLNMAEPTMLGQGLGMMLWDYTIGSAALSSIKDYSSVYLSWANLMSQGIYSLGSLHGMNRRVVTPTWALGMNYSGGQYLQSMVKPSLDGISPDYWYDGSYFIAGGQYGLAAGPMNRAYYFMAEGASSNTASSAYSAFLPEGMPGIGLEKTCKIGYKAVTENLGSPNASVFDMKAALVQAATDLYGAGSAEVQATANAWAAVNVGAAYGKYDPTKSESAKVWFDMHNWPDNSDLGPDGPFEPNPRSQRYPWVPMGEPAQLKVNVSGATDTTIIWTNHPAPFSSSGFFDLSTVNNGCMTPDGVWTPSTRNPTGSLSVSSIQATSKADPKQWAQGLAFGIAFDDDGDGYNDALDLGMVALAYGLPYPILNAVNDYIMAGFPGISEGELQMNLAAFKTAFGN